MLTKSVVVGSLEILESLQMNVREDTVIEEDGVEISRSFNRYVVAPGDDVSNRPKIVQDVTGLLWVGVNV